jgi:hypothetical protein
MHASAGMRWLEKGWWADDFIEWVPQLLEDLDFYPESWRQQLVDQTWQNEPQNRFCSGGDGVQCGWAAFESEKARLLEKLEAEQAARLELEEKLRTLSGNQCGRAACEREKARLREKLEVEQAARLELENNVRKYASHYEDLRKDRKSAKDEVTRLLSFHAATSKSHQSLLEDYHSAREEIARLQSSQHRTSLAFCLIVIISGILCAVARLHQKAEKRKAEVEALTKELQSVKKKFDSARCGIFTVNDLKETLSEEISFCVTDEIYDQLCPNEAWMVAIPNGCEVKVDRQVSYGVDAVTWKNKFQFRLSEGRFEFKTDAIVSENGYLTIAFDARVFDDHVFSITPSQHQISDMHGSNQCAAHMEQISTIEDVVGFSKMSTSESALDADEPDERCACSGATQTLVKVHQGTHPTQMDHQQLLGSTCLASLQNFCPNHQK